MRVLLMMLICLLTLYAPLELSRLILLHGLRASLAFELCFVWIFYLIAMLVIAREVAS